MDEFTQAVKHVQEKCTELLASRRFKMDDLPRNMPLAGIYVLSEKRRMLYVGRTNRMRNRLRYHTRNNHNQATFAFLLAREKTGKTKATYRTAGSRSNLLENPAFREAFDRARERIGKMNVQFIEETDATRQALLEICTALRARAKYNDFDNH